MEQESINLNGELCGVQQDRDMELLSVLAGEYASMYLIDLDTDSYTVYSESQHVPETLKLLDKHKSAKEYFLEIVKSDLVHPDDRKGLLSLFTADDAMQQALTNKKSITRFFRRSYEGEYLWTQMNIIKAGAKADMAHKIVMGFIAKNREVHEQQERQFQVKIFSDTFLYSYVSAYYINLADHSLIIFHRSDELERRYGDINDYLISINRYIDECVYPEDKEMMYEVVKPENIKAKLKKDVSYSVYMRDISDGSMRWYRVDIMRGFDANHVGMAFRNVTDKLVSDKANADRLSEALAEAEKANRSKTNFLFNMSHDIRTPMNAITGFTSMAKKYVNDKEKLLRYLDKIDISGQQLLLLINQVLEMARIESGKASLNEKPVNFKEKFNALVTVFGGQAQTSGLKFRYRMSEIRHALVLVDDARLSSILLNIVGNAMKYTPEGGRIDFRVKEIRPRKKGYASFVFTVVDTGIGMSKDFQQKLFEPFAREKSTTVSKIQGTGLGLSIVKSLVDLMEGEITVQSEPGVGTRFDIVLDFAIVDEDKAEEIEKKAAIATRVGRVFYEGRRILLAEDNEMNREIAKNLLEDKGFIVEEAEDGDIAVEKVREAVERGEYDYYNIVLMDVQMPKMNGYEATRAIRQICDSKEIHIPIIAMTANAFEEDRRNALEAGMDDHLAKPINVKQMFDTIIRFL